MHHPEAHVNPSMQEYKDRKIALKNLSKSKKKLGKMLHSYTK